MKKAAIATLFFIVIYAVSTYACDHTKKLRNVGWSRCLHRTVDLVFEDDTYIIMNDEDGRKIYEELSVLYGPKKDQSSK